MGRVVNHCQQHISVCFGAERSEGFPRPFGKLLPNVERYQKLCSTALTNLLTLTHYSIIVHYRVLLQCLADSGDFFNGRSHVFFTGK